MGRVTVSNKRYNSCEYVGEVLAIPVPVRSRALRKGMIWFIAELNSSKQITAYDLAELEVLYNCKSLFRHPVVYSCDLQRLYSYHGPNSKWSQNFRLQCTLSTMDDAILLFHIMSQKNGLEARSRDYVSIVCEWLYVNRQVGLSWFWSSLQCSTMLRQGNEIKALLSESWFGKQPWWWGWCQLDEKNTRANCWMIYDGVMLANRSGPSFWQNFRFSRSVIQLWTNRWANANDKSSFFTQNWALLTSRPHWDA